MPNPVEPQPISDKIRSQLQDYVTGEITRGVRANWEAVTDPAGFLASTAPAPATLEFSKNITRRVCRAWARGDTPIQGPLSDFVYRPLCSPYLDSLGETPTGGQLGLPFSGGQCTNSLYAVSGTWEFQVTGANVAPTNFAPGNWQVINNSTAPRGPIRGVSTQVAGSNREWVLGCNVSGVPANLRIFRAGASGNAYVWEGATRNNSSTWARNVVITSIIKMDAGADSCGNPAPIYTPPTTKPSLPGLSGEPLPFPGVGTVPVSVSFDEDGNIRVDFPSLGYSIDVPNPLKPAQPGQPGEGLPPGFQGVAGTESPETEDEEEGEDENRDLLGVLVKISRFPSRANVNFNSTQSYFKGAYYVYMGGDGGLAQEPAAISTLSQFYYAREGCNRWSVQPNQGYAVKVTPFFKE